MHSAEPLPRPWAMFRAPEFPVPMAPIWPVGEVMRRQAEIGAVLLAIQVPEVSCSGTQGEQLDLRLVIGRDIEFFFSETWEGWRYGVRHPFAEAQITRLVSGWSLLAPFHGGRQNVFLPGERGIAECMYVHRDGCWEGKLLAITVNDMSDEMIDRLNAMIGGPDSVMALRRGRHGLRLGHLVTFRPCEGGWTTDQRLGGLA